MLHRTTLGILLLTGLLFSQTGCESPTFVTEKQQKNASQAVKKVDPPAPEQFQVKFETSNGDFLVDVKRNWAPKGADRFYHLVQEGFYDNCRFFRFVDGFVVQFGINGEPTVNGEWKDANIDDDTLVESNLKGTVTFATSGPNSRTTQVFINLGNNSRLDAMGFTPFGKVTEGMDNVERLFGAYGEKPNQEVIQYQGNKYLKEEFPNLDFIRKATIVSAPLSSTSPSSPFK